MRNIFGILLSILMLSGPGLSWSGALVQPEQLTAQTAAKYTVFPMKSSYAERDKQRGVVHMTAEERETHRAVIVNGIIYDNKGGVFPDSRLAGGTLQYVMDKAGNLYVFDDMPQTRHSSIFAGEPVAAAGDIHTENGFVTYIDANSGHYFVFTSYGRDALDQVIRELIARGVDTNAMGSARAAALN